MLIYPVGATAACRYAADAFPESCVTDHPCPEVTHVLLDVPSFSGPGILRDGTPVRKILECIPESAAILGGNLKDEALAERKCYDLLADPAYLAENAAITAECAVILAGSRMDATIRNSKVLVIGWGRIGKCLSRLLAAMGADVDLWIRRPEERAMAHALGYNTPVDLLAALPKYALILNTAPEPVITAEQSRLCRDCLKIDLASKPGILGTDVITARGLPGTIAPKSSGRLIAQTVLRLLEGEA